ncbi:MAG: flavodoxin [Eubacteriales bacterium]|nr:flavodoxin [Eubacteriales bacterium]
MGKTLVAYFSATGTTAKVAKRLADVVGADLHEIEPEIPYTAEDLNWMNKKSRTGVEMENKSFRPAIRNRVEDMAQYDTLFVGFPIWWYVAPTIINTFLEQYEWRGTKIIPFATSGSSEIEKTNSELVGSCPGADLREGKRFSADVRPEKLKAWADSY